jgi:multidrug efflux system outer membrane protein
MNKRRLAQTAAFVSGLALTLSGCMSGPDYKPPETGVTVSDGARGDFMGSSKAGLSGEDLPDRWWQLYNNAELNALIEEALANNTDLRVAEANLKRANAVFAQSRAARQLSTTVGAGTSAIRPDSTLVVLPSVVGYDGGISLNLPLDLSGQLRRAIEAAHGDVEVEIAARDAVRVAIAAETTRAYAEVCAANHELHAAHHVLDIQQGTLNATQRLAKGGRGTSFDVSRAQAAVDETAASVPQFTAKREGALLLLAALMGRAPSDQPTDIAHCAHAPSLSAPLPTGDGYALLKRRPDIRAAERALAADTARVGVAMAALYPQVRLGGSVGLSGPFQDIGSANSFRYTIGPLLSWTFPNRPVVRAQIAAAEAAAEGRLAAYEGSVIKALREVETAMSGYVASLEKQAALRRARDSAQLAEQQASKLYHFGRTDFLQLLTSQNALARAEAVLADADAVVTQRQIDIFAALGGGWQDLPAPTAKAEAATAPHN